MTPSVETRAERFLTSEEVLARLLGNWWLRSRAATCVLPAVRVGMEWRFRLSDLEAWIAEQYEQDEQGDSAAGETTRF